MTADHTKSGSAWRAGQLSWRLLTPSEKRQAILIAIAKIFVSLLDTVALIGVMPLISLIVDPAVLTTNQAISTLHKMIGAPDFDSFVKLVAFAAIGLIVASVAMNFVMMFVNKRFRISCQNRLSIQLMARCVGAPYDWLLRQNSTTLSHYVFNDVLAWSSGAINGMIAIIGHVSLLLLIAIVVLSAAELLGIIGMLIIGILAVAVMLALRPRIRQLSEFRRVSAARSFSFASEFLGGIKDVKLSGRESVFVGVFGESFDTYGEAMGRLKILHAISPLAMLFLGQAGIIIIVLLLWGSGRSSGEVATEMALVLLVTTRVIPATSKLVGEISAMWNVIPNIEGINSLLKQLPPLQDFKQSMSRDASMTNWNHLEVINVGYRYSSERSVAISDVVATIERGKSYGIVGPTGAGKTTFVDLLLGLLHPSKGEIRVDGILLTAKNSRSWQIGIGYVPQNPLIADDTLLANVAFGVPAKEADETRALHCLEMANLADVVESVTLHGDLGERGNRLSGGQRQRVAIARALYDNPDLLVLDEATSSLDTISERAVQGALDNLRGKVTTVTVAHRLSTIEHCDEIFVFDQGGLIARGSYTELLCISPLFAKMAHVRESESAILTEEDMVRGSES